jgi:hypothetical protein
MSAGQLTTLLDRRDVLAGDLVVTVLVLGLLVHRVRKIAKSERPDEPLSNWAMVAGFGWSSEAVWVLAGPHGADLPTPIRIALFAIFEVILTVFMIRAKRNVRTIGHPGRAGRNAWLVATGMSLVAVWTAHNPGEAFLRLLVPVLLTAMWWDGLVGEGTQRRAGATSWRWTPRRLLLALGAIEPGERDIETVHRERLTQQMTRLYFKVKHGSPRLVERRKARLMRLSLVADDAIQGEVMTRVDRASWFETDEERRAEDHPASMPLRTIPASRAASAKAARARHHSLQRRICVTHGQKLIVAAQSDWQDPRTTPERDQVIRVIKHAIPGLKNAEIAHLALTSEPTVRRALRRTQNPSPPPPVNGRRPHLEGREGAER